MASLPSLTDLFGLAHLVEGQSGSSSRYNATLEQLAVILNKVIENRGYNNSASITPADGQMYYIDGLGSGDWSGHDDELAVYTNGAWSFHPAPTDTFFYVKNDGATTLDRLEHLDTSGSPTWTAI